MALTVSSDYLDELARRRAQAEALARASTGASQQLMGAIHGFDEDQRKSADVTNTALRLKIMQDQDTREGEEHQARLAQGTEGLRLQRVAAEAAQQAATQKAAQAALSTRVSALVDSGVTTPGGQTLQGLRDDPALGAIQGDEEINAAFAAEQRAREKRALDEEKERAGIGLTNAQAEKERAGIGLTNAQAEKALREPTVDPGKAARDNLVQLQTMKLQDELRRGADGKPLGGEQVQKIGEQDAALAQLGTLRDDAKGQSYGISGWAQNIMPDRLKPAKRRAFESKIDRVTQTLAKALEGGKLSEGDVPRYRKMLANATDSEAAFNEVLNEIEQEVRGKITAEKRALKSSGYAVPDTGVDTSTGDDDGADLFGG